MYEVAVLSGDLMRAERLKQYVERYSANTGINLQIKQLSKEYLTKNFKPEYDIFIVDGAENFIEKIRKFDKKAAVIVVDGNGESGELDYNFKEQDFYNFCAVLDKAVIRLQKSDGDYFFLSVKGGVVRIAVKDIIFVECNDHVLTFHTDGGDFVRTGLISRLRKKQFISALSEVNKFKK